MPTSYKPSLLTTTIKFILLASISTGSTLAIADDNNAANYQEPTATLEMITIMAAKDELKQDPSLSIIKQTAIEKQPIANDISEIVRKMPGANLSGSSTSGQRGNQRQIDLRGMGPDNTLILIDGRPVTSRNSIRLGRAGERDSRGDSQWVPPSAIESIEVLRGPAAARYGSGSMGGVINIITKPSYNKEFSITTHYELPANDLEGSSWRTNVNMAGAITDKLSYRTVLGYHDSEGDNPKINADHAVTVLNRRGNEIKSIAAGREGLENIDARQLFEYAINAMNTIGFEISYGQQSNHWAGDSQFQTVNDKLIGDLADKTTNKMTRTGFAVTHKGNYETMMSNSYIEYTRTDNERLITGLAGGIEGQFSGNKNGNYEWGQTQYDTLNAKTEWNKYFDTNTLTFGLEYRGESLDDNVNNQQRIGFDVDGTTKDTSQRDPKTDSYLIGAYVEDNYEINSYWYITPGLRYDYHSESGGNFSPSLNTTWHFSDNWSMKAGVSRAFKAPGLQQLNPNYVYYTRGNGCPSSVKAVFALRRGGGGGNGCYVLGNPNLDNETSVNKELSLTYDDGTGLTAGLTYYHNDYDNRIAAGYTVYDADIAKNHKAGLYRWENQGKAVIEGLEGFMQVPVTDNLKWHTNLTTNIRSERKDNGEPLSLIPKYTINTNVDWDINDKWNANVGLSHYGRIEAPKLSVTTGDSLTSESLDVEPYTIVNANTSYQLSDNIKMGVGIKNLFDTEVKREGTSNNAGARTFNEAGRTYMFDVKLDF